MWKAVQAELELTVSSVHFSTWIKPLALESLGEPAGGRRVATIRCPSQYHQQMVEQRYQGQIQKSLERLTSEAIELSLKVGGEKKEDAEKGRAPLFENTEEDKNKRNVNARGLSPQLTFASYVVGSSNNFAYAAGKAVAKSPGARYNPLFIYGGVGLGKTHLMQAIGNSICEDHPEWTVMYLSAETFVNELIANLQNRRMTSFKKKYRSADVLLVDDIQFIAGKEAMQEEFFHTFNELYMHQRQIILTSDRPPLEINKLEERLSSRFMGGLTVDVQMPDFETRMAILSQKNEALRLEIPPEALSLIAESSTTNIRELEGVLQSIMAKAEVVGGGITAEMVREYFGTTSERRSKRLRPVTIIAKTSQYFNYKSADVVGQSRKAPLVKARHLTAYLLKTELRLPYEQIGEVLGGRDHTTIMHGVEKINKAILSDPELGKIVADIKRLL